MTYNKTGKEKVWTTVTGNKRLTIYLHDILRGQAWWSGLMLHARYVHGVWCILHAILSISCVKFAAHIILVRVTTPEMCGSTYLSQSLSWKWTWYQHESHLIDSLRTYIFQEKVSLIRPPIFRDSTTGFPGKWRLRNERRNSILMTCYYLDLGNASD